MKLTKEQQIRIRHVPTGHFLFKPKGSSTNYRLDEKRYSVWSNTIALTSLENFINSNHSTFRRGRSYMIDGRPYTMKLEEFVLEIVELMVVEEYKVTELIEDRNAKKEKAEDRRLERKFFTPIARVFGFPDNQMPSDDMLKCADQFNIRFVNGLWCVHTHDADKLKRAVIGKLFANEAFKKE